MRGCYVRKQGHSRFDDLLSESKVVWVYGPGGAGKTTLISSYAQQRKRAVVWYRCDETDSDASSFFYYLTSAVEGLVGDGAPLPALTPDQDKDPLPFAKRYFRKLGELISKRTLLVLDDFHAICEDSAVPQALAVAIEELPDHVQVFIAGRASPNSSFARLQLHGDLAVVGLTELNFSLDEISDLASRYRSDISPDSLAEIYNVTKGWVAGTMLLIKDNPTNSNNPTPSRFQTPQLIYDYFAQEVFEELPEDAVTLLLKTSMLDDISPQLAQDITGLENAAMILAELAFNQVFIDRTIGEDDWYGCHPLFREFLQRKAKLILGDDGVRDAKRAAGNALMTSKQSELSANLLLDVGDWEGLKQWLKLNTAVFIESNRNRFILRVLDAIPEQERGDDYCLLYWRGVALLPLAPTEAGNIFESTYRLADKADDAVVAVQAWCSTVEAMLLAWDSLDRCERWWDEYYRIQEKYAKKIGQALSVRLTIFTFILATAWPKDDKLMAGLALQVNELFPLLKDPNQQAIVAITLFLYRFYCGDQEGFRDSKAMMEALVQREGLSAASRAVLYSHLAYTVYMDGNVEGVYETVQKGLDIADENQINLHKVLLYLCASNAAAVREDADKMGEVIARCQQIPLQTRRLDLGHLYCHQGFRAAVMGDLDTAYDLVMKAGELTKNLQVAVQRSLGNSLRSFICAALGRHDEAEIYLRENRQLVEGAFKSAERLRMVNHITAAWMAFCKQDWAQCEQSLRDAFAIGMKSDIRLWLYFWPQAVRQLYSFALKHNIYPQYTRSLIQIAQLAPPPDAVMPNEWNYEFEIQAFSDFEIRRNGRRMDLSRYRKPVELLKVLIAFGARQVSETVLIDALWPDADGDTAHSSFATNLHRLRKLLGQENLILVDGKLSLNLQSIWLDAMALEGFAQQWVERKDDASLDEFAENINALYQGTFLGHDEEAWVLAGRERLRNRFYRLISAISDALVAQARCPDAIVLLEQAIDREPGVEVLYQQLLRCYQVEGRQGDADLLLERCTRELASRGKTVSKETLRLHRAVQ